MFRVAIFAVAVAVCYAATTTTSMPMTDDMTTTMAAMQPMVFFDLKHHLAVIVRTTAGTSNNVGDAVGCYEHHMSKDDIDNVNAGMTEPAAMSAISALNAATAVHRMGHNHVNHLAVPIPQQCTDMPIFKFD